MSYPRIPPAPPRPRHGLEPPLDPEKSEDGPQKLPLGLCDATSSEVLAPERIHSAFPAICFLHDCFHLSRLFARFVRSDRRAREGEKRRDSGRELSPHGLWFRAGRSVRRLRGFRVASVPRVQRLNSLRLRSRAAAHHHHNPESMTVQRFRIVIGQVGPVARYCVNDPEHRF